jgi:Tfp pilus assembly protein PilN
MKTIKRINLLPKLKQEELSYERLFYSVAVAAVAGIVIILLAVVVQFGVFLYLERKAGSVETEIEQLKKLANKSENSAVKQQINLVNTQIEDFTKLSGVTPQWANVIAAFVKNVPPTVKISQFDANTDKAEINISGYSPTRDLVIDLYNNINTDKDHFKNINYPLDNVTQPTNVRFSFKFYVADGMLVKEAK